MRNLACLVSAAVIIAMIALVGQAQQTLPPAPAKSACVPETGLSLDQFEAEETPANDPESKINIERSGSKQLCEPVATHVARTSSAGNSLDATSTSRHTELFHLELSTGKLSNKRDSVLSPHLTS